MTLPFALGSVMIRQDSDYQQVIDTGFIPVVVSCGRCGASYKTSMRVLTRESLVYLANQLSKHYCPERGHGSYEV